MTAERVLVVDDEAPIRLLCRVNLEADGMTVLEAADGISGLETARAELPDAVLLDVRMPGFVALMWRIEPTMRKNGTIVPNTIIHIISVQIGRCRSERFPSSETLLPGTSKGKVHHGWTIAQKTAAKRKPQQRSEIGSR